MPDISIEEAMARPLNPDDIAPTPTVDAMEDVLIQQGLDWSSRRRTKLAEDLVAARERLLENG